MSWSQKLKIIDIIIISFSFKLEKNMHAMKPENKETNTFKVSLH